VVTLAMSLTEALSAAEPAAPISIDSRPGKIAPKPLYRDPVFDGAADPVVIWNRHEGKWFMFYTNRRANVPGLDGVTWVHGTPIGIAESADGGVTWIYRGDAQINYGEKDYTYWAPDVIEHAGIYHMYLSIVPGVFADWQHPRHIVHLASGDLLKWKYESTLQLASDRVIDACVFPRPDGTWRMWYNNERDHKSIYYADSPDLYTWTDRGKAAGVGERPGEGPYVFRWKDHYWMLVDIWKGLGVYRSDDLQTWQAQPTNLLGVPGHGQDDGVNGGHPGVVVSGDRAYCFYFTHPGRAGTIAPQDKTFVELRRSSIQVVELEFKDGWLACDRDQATHVDLQPPAPVEPPPFASARSTQVIDGVTYEYALEHEDVVRELAPLVSAMNREAAASLESAKPAGIAPLSVQDLREHRVDYLARIAAAIGLEKATAQQEQCYDAFLENFEQTELLWSTLKAQMRRMAEVRVFAVWSKDDLMRRLKAGQTVTGFSLDPDGKHVNFAFKWNFDFAMDPQVREQLTALARERERRRLDYYYNYSAKDGVATISGGVRPSKSAHGSHPKPAEQPSAATPLPAFPLAITPDKASLPPGELAAELVKWLRSFRNTFASDRPVENQAQLAYLILHETTEIGIVDRYIGSSDRRWLCEGVANYTAWRIARDAGGEAVARQVFELPAQLAQYADLRPKIDLRKWPGAENQREADANTPLTKAHYAFATRAVSLIIERHGEDFPAKLLQEVGKTPRRKTTMRTVEKAYKKLARGNLAAVVDAAMAPPLGKPPQP
jgi:hypothetical protein